MATIYILWWRELLRYVRTRRLTASLTQPIFYLLVFGFGFGTVFRAAGRGEYVQFIAPGMILMAVLFSAVTSGIGVVFDRQYGFLKETLAAPVPRLHVMLGRTLGVATIASIQGCLICGVCVIAGFRFSNLTLLPVAFVFVVLTAVTFAAMGTAIGSVVKEANNFGMMTNSVVQPLALLSGALFPLDSLPQGFETVIRLNPFTYAVDGLRGALISQSHFGMWLDALVLIVLAVIVTCVGAWSFSKAEV